MMKYFHSSEDRGQLYINYPMMQSYRHLKQLPDFDFYQSKLHKKDFNNYKAIVTKESCILDVNRYDYPLFVSLAIHHLMKAHYLLTGKHELPTMEDYENLDLFDIFNIEYSNMQNGYISILNTCIFILINYKPTTFFENIMKHRARFMIPH